MAMQIAIEVKGVRKTYRSGFWLKPVEVLQGVSFEVEKGTTFGFLGENGAGKTTLIHILTGIKRCSSGQVQLLGQQAHQQRSKMQIGYLPERPYFYRHLTAAGLLTHFARLSGIPASETKSRVKEVLNQVGLENHQNRELGRFSKGMLQRVGLAQAIFHDPSILILDEPMSGLDPGGRKFVRDLILKLGDQGKTIFFSTHILSDIEQICDQVGIIHQGKMLKMGKPSEFHPSLESFFDRAVGGTG